MGGGWLLLVWGLRLLGGGLLWGRLGGYMADALRVSHKTATRLLATLEEADSHLLQIEISLSGGVWMWAEDDRKEIAV